MPQKALGKVFAARNGSFLEDGTQPIRVFSDDVMLCQQVLLVGKLLGVLRV